MKKQLVIIFLLACIRISHAQNIMDLMQRSLDLANKGEHARSLEVADTLYDLQPFTFESYSLIGYNQVCLGNLQKAGLYLAAGLQVEPTEYSLYINSGYYLALKGDN